MNLGQLLPGLQQEGILAVEADSRSTLQIQVADDGGIYLAGENHLGNLYSLLVSDTETGYELRLLAHLLQHAGDVRAAAVDDDRTDADIFHEGNVLHDHLLQFVAYHGIAAVLDDYRLAGKLLNVRERGNQNGSCILS